MSQLQYVFRRPRFPIICDVNGDLVAGGTLQQFERRLAKRALPNDAVFKIVDATGEGWALHPDLQAISPLTLDKRWTKARVITMFDSSVNAQRTGLRYPQRSLANRRLDAVIRDVVDLLNQAEELIRRQPQGSQESAMPNRPGATDGGLERPPDVELSWDRRR